MDTLPLGTFKVVLNCDQANAVFFPWPCLQYIRFLLDADAHASVAVLVFSHQCCHGHARLWSLLLFTCTKHHVHSRLPSCTALCGTVTWPSTSKLR